MAHVERYHDGEPCWADLQTPDVTSAKDFYGRVFGWTYKDLPTPDGQSYAQAFAGGYLVAAIAPQGPLERGKNPHAQWHVYLASTDAEAVVQDVAHAGGAAEFGPEAAGDTGVLAFVAAPGGGTTGIWQAGTHRGSHLFNEPGALAWAELSTPRPQDAVGFLQQLFGNDVTEYGQDDGGSYSVLMAGGKEVAGVVPAEEDAQAEWNIYFGIADLRAALAAVVDAGGEVLVEPAEGSGEGPATIRDPQGGILSLIQVAGYPTIAP